MISVHDMKLESTVIKRDVKSKETPSIFNVVHLIENGLLENRFMISNFKRKISGYIKCQMYYEIATL